MKAKSSKTLRDPVHGNIELPDPLIEDLVDTFEFQRLRRIRQLGSCSLVFHGAEHSRFQHALGTMWLMHKVLSRWQEEGSLILDEQVRKAALAAALLHDIGHGPFSHALEHTFVGLHHEVLSQQIITSKLAEVLEAHQVPASLVCDILSHRYQDPVLCELISGQLDVDRMDYLQRDSIYTGVKYGLFDCERILATLIPINSNLDQENLFGDSRDGLVLGVDSKGVLAVEEFLFSRYFMYWQVYLHRTVRAAEMLLKLIMERARVVFQKDSSLIWLPPNLKFLFSSDEPPESSDFLHNFLELDDFDILHAIKMWRSAKDIVLQDLSRRFLSRELFKGVELSAEPHLLSKLKKKAQDLYQENWTYYLRIDPIDSISYGIYRPGTDRPIRTSLAPKAGWQEISRATRSTAILGLAQNAMVSGGYLFFCRKLL